MPRQRRVRLASAGSGSDDDPAPAAAAAAAGKRGKARGGAAPAPPPPPPPAAPDVADMASLNLPPGEAELFAAARSVVPTRTLAVAGLQRPYREAAVREALAAAGAPPPAAAAIVVSSLRTHAFVDYADVGDAAAARERMAGRRVGDRAVATFFAAIPAGELPEWERGERARQRGTAAAAAPAPAPAAASPAPAPAEAAAAIVTKVKHASLKATASGPAEAASSPPADAIFTTRRQRAAGAAPAPLASPPLVPQLAPAAADITPEPTPAAAKPAIVVKGSRAAAAFRSLHGPPAVPAPESIEAPAASVASYAGASEHDVAVPEAARWRPPAGGAPSRPAATGFLGAAGGDAVAVSGFIATAADPPLYFAPADEATIRHRRDLAAGGWRVAVHGPWPATAAAATGTSGDGPTGDVEMMAAAATHETVPPALQPADSSGGWSAAAVSSGSDADMGRQRGGRAAGTGASRRGAGRGGSGRAPPPASRGHADMAAPPFVPPFGPPPADYGGVGHVAQPFHEAGYGGMGDAMGHGPAGASLPPHPPPGRDDVRRPPMSDGGGPPAWLGRPLMHERPPSDRPPAWELGWAGREDRDRSGPAGAGAGWRDAAAGAGPRDHVAAGHEVPWRDAGPAWHSSGRGNGGDGWQPRMPPPPDAFRQERPPPPRAGAGPRWPNPAHGGRDRGPW